MSNKRVAVRLVAEGGRNVKAEFKGVGDSGEREFGRIERAADATGAVVKRVMGILGAAISIRQIANYADTWTDLRSRVDLATGSQERGALVMERLSDMARRTYSSLEQTTESYLANATALRELGMSTRESLDFTEALNNALVVSGARQERAASVSNALSQAMALGQLRGDQLNTVIQNGGRVAELLAAELGVTVSGLRGLGTQGAITGDVIRRALVGNLELLREEADSMPATMGDAFTLMGNAALTLVGTFDVLLGASSAVADGIIFLADNLQRVASYGIALAGFMGGRFVVSFIAARVATMSLSGALVLLRGAIIRTGIGALIVGAGELIFWFSRLVQGAGGFGEALGLLRDVAVEVWDRIKAGTIGLGAAMATVWYDFKADTAEAMQAALESVVGFGNNALNTFEGAYEAIKVIWGNLPAAIGDFAFQAANTLISGVEAMLNAVVERINRFVAGLNAALAYLPDWVTGGEPIEIGRIDPLQLGRITNQFEGAAARAGSAARDAFRAAFDSDTIEVPDFGLEDIARASRQTAQEFRESYQDIFAGLTLPLESWEALRQAMVAAGEDGSVALDDVAASGDRVAAALDNAGGAGGRAGRAVRDAAEGAKVGWDALLEKLNEYVAAARDIGAEVGDVIVGAFRGIEDAIVDFVKTGKLSFKDMITSMIADLARLAARRFILGPIMGALSNALGGLGGSFGAAMASAFAPARSFDGGGHTGYGARAGGLDGRGGYLAMVHPRERIIDETRGGRRGRDMAPVVVNIQTRDADSFRQSRTQIAADMQRAVAMGRRGM
jgi:tape measure domain-containing protein